MFKLYKGFFEMTMSVVLNKFRKADIIISAYLNLPQAENVNDVFTVLLSC